MRLAIVVVSHNTVTCCKPACTASLHRLSMAHHLSTSMWWWSTMPVMMAAPAWCTDQFPHVHLIASDNNLGFTAANNLALNRLGFPIGDAAPPNISRQMSDPQKSANHCPDYVLLLNPDTQVLMGSIRRMVEFYGFITRRWRMWSIPGLW